MTLDWLAGLSDLGSDEEFEAKGEDVVSPEDEPGGENGEEGVLEELAAYEDLACSATAIELDRAERDMLGLVNAEGPAEDEQCKWHKHGGEQEGSCADGDAKHKKCPAEYFEPRQRGGDKVQEEVLVSDIVLTDQLEEFDRVERLAEAHVYEQGAQQPASEQSPDVRGTEASGGDGFGGGGDHRFGWMTWPLPRTPTSKGIVFVHSEMPAP